MTAAASGVTTAGTTAGTAEAAAATVEATPTAPDTAMPQLVTVGRVSVDLYAQQSGAGFDAGQTFVMSVGGCPTNVAVAAARLGVRTAAVTAVGDDGFGAFVRARLESHGVDTRWVRRVPGALTPLAIVALDAPESPTVAFYRGAAPPDLQLTADMLPAELVRDVPALWVSHATLAAGPVADAVRTWLDLRGRGRYTVLDLDHRPALWPDAAAAGRSAAAAIAACDVVVGNREECRVAVGTDDPDGAVDALLAAGVTLAVVKLGPDGVLLATARNRVRVPAPAVDVVCGLGAGDAFGGALVRGLLAGPPPADLAPQEEARLLTDLGRTGAAAGAFVAARLTCSDDMPTPADLTAALCGGRAVAASGSSSPSEGSSAASRRPLGASPMPAGLTRERYADLLEARVRRPRAVHDALRSRERRDLVGPDGRLLVVAADHTSRGKVAVGGASLGAADRFTLLDRLVRLLAVPGVDGVLGSADVLEDLAWLGALDGRLALGTMNRGGIVGARWELDDRMTAYDAERIAAAGLDGGKTMIRLHDDDPGVARTLESVAGAVTALADLGLMAVVEALPFRTDDAGRAVLDTSHARMVQAVAVASGLGSSSVHTWLKIPPVAGIAEVAATTSLPILLLGGDSGPDTAGLTESWRRGLSEPNVRGLIPGRALIYPHDGDVEGAAARAVEVVHG